jgi:hypothetical protein
MARCLNTFTDKFRSVFLYKENQTMLQQVAVKAYSNSSHNGVDFQFNVTLKSAWPKKLR